MTIVKIIAIWIAAQLIVIGVAMAHVYNDTVVDGHCEPVRAHYISDWDAVFVPLIWFMPDHNMCAAYVPPPSE